MIVDNDNCGFQAIEALLYFGFGSICTFLSILALFILYFVLHLFSSARLHSGASIKDVPVPSGRFHGHSGWTDDPHDLVRRYRRTMNNRLMSAGQSLLRVCSRPCFSYRDDKVEPNGRVGCFCNLYVNAGKWRKLFYGSVSSHVSDTPTVAYRFRRHRRYSKSHSRTASAAYPTTSAPDHPASVCDCKRVPKLSVLKSPQSQLSGQQISHKSYLTKSSFSLSRRQRKLYFDQPLNLTSSMAPAKDPAKDSSSDGSGSRPSTPPAIYAVMPRPGQSGALYFDGQNVTEFLENWESECDDYHYDDAKRCERLPFYCERTIRDVVKDLSGYTTKKWDELKKELKALYWQNDKPRNTTTALHQLTLDAQSGKLDLNVYVLRYSAVSDALVQQGALSSLDRVNRLLDGLSEDHRRKVLSFCVKKGWKLSAEDVGKINPVYDELREFVLREAQTTQALAAYGKEKSIRDGHSGPEPRLAPSLSATSAPANSDSNSRSSGSASTSSSTSTSAPTSTPVRDDSMDELTRLFAQISLFLQANSKSQPFTGSSGFNGLNRSNDLGGFNGSSGSDRTRPSRCMWCDILGHTRRECSEFAAALRSGVVRFNTNGRLVNCATGEEFPTMFGKGGMKVLVPKPDIQTNVASYNVENIRLEDMYGQLGTGSAFRTTLDLDNNVRIDKIVDVDVEEKRRRQPEPPARSVRPRLDDSQTPTPVPVVSPSDQLPRSAPDIDMSDVPPVQPYRREQPAAPLAEVGRKFRLASDLSRTTSVAQVGEKILDTPVQLSMREVFAVSGDVAGYLHEQTRKRRVPIDPNSSTGATMVSSTTANSSDSANVNSVESQSFYALPSGRVKATLDDRVNVTATLDNGSEVNLMPKRVYDLLELPIDTEIRWRINAYNTDTDLESADPIGVCHNVPVDIGGVMVKLHFFVVKHSNADLILGRPWERAVRANFSNDDDGTYTVRIKSPDSLREVQFCASKPNHERNREAVRSSDDVARLRNEPLAAYHLKV
jgi:hypothetical protein